MTIKDFFYIGATAWQAITPKTIEGCWMHGLSTAFIADDVPGPAESDVSADEDDNEQHDINSSDDEEFYGFTAEEVQEVNQRQARQFHAALVNDGLGVALGNIDIWLNIDDPAPTNAILSDAEIVASVTEIGSGLQSDSEDEDIPVPQEPPRIPTAKEAAAGLEVASSWLETQQISSVKIMQAQNLITLAKRAEQFAKKQLKVTDFFKRH